MVSNRLQRRVALRRKLHILRTITHSKSVKKNCIIKDALLYIYLLKLKLESIKRELSCLTEIKKSCLTLMDQLHLPKKEVKVDKVGKGFVVRVVSAKNEENYLVKILEVFEEMALTVLHAKVSCKSYFSMEAIIVADNQQHDDADDRDIKDITQALLKAIHGQYGESGISSVEN